LGIARSFWVDAIRVWDEREHYRGDERKRQAARGPARTTLRGVVIPLRIPCPRPREGQSVARTPDEAPLASRASGTRVWLARHAEVHEDWHHRAYGSLDVPLSQRGLEQTTALVRSFGSTPLARVASSDLQRARRLGRELAQASRAELVIDARWREVDRGAWQGIDAADFKTRWEADADAFFADPWRWQAHRGESDEQLYARVRPAFEDLVRAADGGTVAAAAHSNVIRVLLGRLLGRTAFESYELKLDPAHAALVVDGPDGWVLERMNVS
jgi:broad specificity phosphatase PhoE